MTSLSQKVHVTIDTPGLLQALHKIVDEKLQEMPGVSASIGIGITTHNRNEVFAKCYAEMQKYLPPGAKLVVVDDGSNQPVNKTLYPEVFRFDTCVGIAVAKNKCLELLEDCAHIFLFDDDTWPLTEGWYKPYVASREPHLMYIFQDFSTGTKLNDTLMLYADQEIRAFSHPRGCMCYFKQVCLEKVGGMYPGFGRWGWEHPDLSNRIYNYGLTTFRFMDVIGSKDLIYSLDEHEKVVSTVPPHGDERQTLIRRNRPIYESRKDSKEFVPYKEKNDILLTCYFNGATDPQRGNTWPANDPEALRPLIESLNGLKLIVLTDCMSSYVGNGVEIIKVQTGKLNPYFQRWVSYRQYIQDNRDLLRYVFCVDATDVEVLRNPFPDMQTDHLYVGDEADIIANEWMLNHHKHPDLMQLYKSYGQHQIMNAGLCGGTPDILIEFMKDLTDFYCQAEEDHRRTLVPTAGATDMAAFNWVVRNRFANRFIHGTTVNTRFKANERNALSWFKHK